MGLIINILKVILMLKKLLIIIVVLISSHGYSQGMFSVEHKNMSFHVGSGTAYDSRYTVLGINVNYFVIKNLTLGVGYTAWFGGDPKINKVSLPITYYLPVGDSIRPYLGVVYHRTFIGDGYDDYNSYSGRVGVAISNGGSFLRLGWVQEYYDNDNTDDEKKSEGYPEVSGGYSF